MSGPRDDSGPAPWHARPFQANPFGSSGTSDYLADFEEPTNIADRHISDRGRALSGNHRWAGHEPSPEAPARPKPRLVSIRLQSLTQRQLDGEGGA